MTAAPGFALNGAGCGGDGSRPFLRRLIFASQQAAHEILEAHVLEVVVADDELLAGGVDGA